MVTNIAAYHFTPIDAPEAFAAELRERAEALALRGSVLVAGEGVNLFLAGSADAIDAFRREPTVATFDAASAHDLAPVDAAWQRVQTVDPHLARWLRETALPVSAGARLVLRAHRARERSARRRCAASRR